MKGSLINRLKNKISKGIVIGLAGLMPYVSGCKDNGSSEGSSTPEKGKISGEITYRGTANPLPVSTRKLEIWVTDINYNGLSLLTFDVLKSWLTDGYRFDIPYRYEPGSYYLQAFWDVEADGTESNKEPWGRSKQFEVSGGKEAFVMFEIFDRVRPSESGSVGGSILYRGTEAGLHKLFVAVKNFDDYKVVIQQEVTSLQSGIPKEFLEDGFEYGVSDVPPGGPYRVGAFWDINDNGYYDNDPFGFYPGVIQVSPGLEELDVNIELKR